MTIMKKTYPLVLIVILLLSCVGAVYAASQDASSARTRTIVDSAGVSVQIPDDIQKVVILCQGGASQDVLILGGADKIIAAPPQNYAPLLLKMFPTLKDVPNAGSFDNLNMESILKLEPDIAINSVTATKGNPNLVQNNVPVIQLLTGMAQMDTIISEFKMMGEVFKNPSKTDEIVSYWDYTIKLVNDRTSTLSDSEKKQVYYMLGGPLHTNGLNMWGHSFITTAGGINVADEIGNNRDINAEQLSEWDPDVIIVSSNEGKYVSDDEIKNNPQLSELKAVKSGSIYHVPIGGFWWDRPSPESPLGFLWLAKTLYPEKFADIDMKSEMKKFFTKFYEYDLSDDEIEQVLKAEDPAA
ncbi:ABC transporter substrate-binding protein [Methanospirillum sp.]|uniref:ABC transporter substrate-binding protein n=1 Tax=Methanospirillum sp. TaxID=45200 RepID=UPI00359FCEEB